MSPSSPPSSQIRPLYVGENRGKPARDKCRRILFASFTESFPTRAKKKINNEGERNHSRRRGQQTQKPRERDLGLLSRRLCVAITNLFISTRRRLRGRRAGDTLITEGRCEIKRYIRARRGMYVACTHVCVCFLERKFQCLIRGNAGGERERV